MFCLILELIQAEETSVPQCWNILARFLFGNPFFFHFTNKAFCSSFLPYLFVSLWLFFFSIFRDEKIFSRKKEESLKRPSRLCGTTRFFDDFLDLSNNFFSKKLNTKSALMTAQRTFCSVFFFFKSCNLCALSFLGD